MADEIRVEILPDGRMKVETGAISAVSHKAADDLLKFIEEAMGGKSIIWRKVGHSHLHHGVIHTH